MTEYWNSVSLGDLLSPSNEAIQVNPDEAYNQITVKMWGNGVIPRGEVFGSQLGSSRWYVARQGQIQ